MRLRQIFGRATSQNAILILDEADVFLVKCDRKDLLRNPFVSSKSTMKLHEIIYLAKTKTLSSLSMPHQVLPR